MAANSGRAPRQVAPGQVRLQYGAACRHTLFNYQRSLTDYFSNFNYKYNLVFCQAFAIIHLMIKIISQNKKAHHNYEILQSLEAGLVLTGAEIKAIRAGKVNLTGSYARVLQMQNVRSEASIKKQVSSIKKSKILNTKYQILTSQNKQELFLLGAHISVVDNDPHLRQGYGGQATRTRKLLLHRKEIDRLIGKIQQKNLTLVPLKIYLKNGRAKIELGLARGKKLHDKREAIKKRDLDREVRKS